MIAFLFLPDYLPWFDLINHNTIFGGAIVGVLAHYSNKWLRKG